MHSARVYDTSVPWQPELTASLERAIAADRRIFLAMDEESLWPEVLAIAALAWDRIDFVEVGHETSWTRAETEDWVRRLEAAFAAQGLARKPIGIVWDIDRALITEAVDAPGRRARSRGAARPAPAHRRARARDGRARAVERRAHARAASVDDRWRDHDEHDHRHRRESISRAARASRAGTAPHPDL